jgi:hypothetical protein
MRCGAILDRCDDSVLQCLFVVVIVVLYATEMMFLFGTRQYRLEDTERKNGIKRWDGWEDMQPLYLRKARHGMAPTMIPKGIKEKLSIFLVATYVRKAQVPEHVRSMDLHLGAVSSPLHPHHAPIHSHSGVSKSSRDAHSNSSRFIHPLSTPLFNEKGTFQAFGFLGQGSRSRY